MGLKKKFDERYPDAKYWAVAGIVTAQVAVAVGTLGYCVVSGVKDIREDKKDN